MEATLATHILMWIIAGTAVVGTIGTIGAFFSMGRQAYRKD